MQQVLLSVGAIALAAAGAWGQGPGRPESLAQPGKRVAEARPQAGAPAPPAPEKAAKDSLGKDNHDKAKTQPLAQDRGSPGRQKPAEDRARERRDGLTGTATVVAEGRAAAWANGKVAEPKPRPARTPRNIHWNQRDYQRQARTLDDGRRVFERPESRASWVAAASGGLIQGCPPGLANRDPSCVPPGQAREKRTAPFDSFGPDWWGLPRLDDGRFVLGEGTLLRLDGGRVVGYIPLLGGALAPGNPWPDAYEPLSVPRYHVNYFGLGPPESYRYADNVLYRVDPDSSLITAVAALLAGDDFRVGQPLPAGYDVYNVPFRFRESYPDGPDAIYRYSDGYVYRVDPRTRLVTAAIELLMS